LGIDPNGPALAKFEIHAAKRQAIRHIYNGKDVDYPTPGLMFPSARQATDALCSENIGWKELKKRFGKNHRSTWNPNAPRPSYPFQDSQKRGANRCRLADGIKTESWIFV
jgi:hypothetical protein